MASAAASGSPSYAQEASELVEGLRSLLQRVSALLEPAAGGRPPRRGSGTGDLVERRILAFLKTELTGIVASLLPDNNPADDDSLLEWLRLWRNASLIQRKLPAGTDHPPAGCRTLLRRAMRCFRGGGGGSSEIDLLWYARLIFWEAEDPCRYRLSLQRPHPHQVHYAVGGLPPSSPSCLVGIDRPVKKLLRWLIPPAWGVGETEKKKIHLRVMAIVGPVGVGKTTLARELRNRLVGHHPPPGGAGGGGGFQHSVMAQASRGDDRNELLLQYILSQVSDDNDGPAAPAALSSDHQSQPKTMEMLVHLVSERLQNKRYFIIIDDIWEASDWQKISGAFPRNNNLGSCILVTTRVTSTAWACCSDSDDGLVHDMKPLNQTDSERLLLARAFGTLELDGCSLPVDAKQLCDEILGRCEGIPLFIAGMADSFGEEFSRWQRQQQEEDEDKEHERFATHREERVPLQLPKRFEQALCCAFNDVPVKLRLPCLCMSMLPYGYKFDDMDRLSWKWLWEGPISKRFWEGPSETLLEVEKLFTKLVDLNVVTYPAGNYRHILEEAKTGQWHVNHFMHQFLASKSAEIGFVFTSATLNKEANRTPRRLALHHPDPNIPSLLEAMDLSQTRSLAVSGAVTGIPLHKFVDLVVLDLEGWEHLKDEDLLQVCRSKMFFLSYLSIRNTRVTKLPNEIKELRALRSLDVRCTHISELPLEVFELTSLWRLDLRGTRISQLPKQIARLWELNGLLVGGGGIINSVETRVPDDVRHLQVLKTLATIDLTQRPASFVRALGYLDVLEVLAITWSFHHSTDKDYREALLSSMGEWGSLKSLTIHCGLGCSMEFLGSLSHPPSYLKKLKVTGGRFACVPCWINELKDLTFLQITICKQGVGDLEILGGLPKLECLILGLDIIPGEAVVIENTGFPELQRLSIDCPMPWLTFSQGAMRKLTYLQLKFCATPARQHSVPSGIGNLRRITEIALCYYEQYSNSPSVKMTVEAVTKQVAEHRNPIDLYMNGIEQDDVQAVDEVTEYAVGSPSGNTAGTSDDGAQAVHEEAAAAVLGEITEADE